MDQFLEFMKYAAPLAVVVGGSFSITQAVFKLHWRVAVVERDTAEALQRLAEFRRVSESVTRIEENVEELLGERRHRERRERRSASDL